MALLYMDEECTNAGKDSSIVLLSCCRLRDEGVGQVLDDDLGDGREGNNGCENLEGAFFIKPEHAE